MGAIRTTGRALGAVLASATLMGAAPVPQAPSARCGNLFALTSAVEKQTRLAADIGSELDQKHWRTLSPTWTDAAFNAVASAAITEAERRVAAVSDLDDGRDNVETLFARSKAVILASLQAEAGLNSETKTQMTRWIGRVALIDDSAAYVTAIIAAEKASGSSLADEQLRQQAYMAYIRSCGRNGLAGNAFFEERLKAVVVCPGILLGLHDYGGARQDQAAALMFTLGHEIGHAADWSYFPHVYSMMGRCYEDITGYREIWSPGLADEITADHWGAVVLADALRTRAGGPPASEQIVKIIAYATDGWDQPADPSSPPPPHAPSEFRVNQTIARHPAMAALLGCPAAGEANPTCALTGKNA